MRPFSSLRASCRRSLGFTLIELLVVMAVIATLVTLVSPQYFESLARAKESALKTNLRLMREAIDKHVADTGQYPASLEALVTAKYLREIPEDSISERTDTWIAVPYPDHSKPGVYDVKSGAPGTARNGVAYGAW